MIEKTPTTRFQAISSDTNGTLAPKGVTALWSRFNHVYGHRWETGYGPALNDQGELTDAAKTWGRALAGFGPDELARGLRGCVERGDGWPPTLPEFIALCRPPPTRLAPYHALAPKALPVPESVKEARRVAGCAALAQMKTILKIQPKRVECHN
ncbi:MAG: hypothetical protein H6975_03675 [Gammaproteobacteria bacterium]|nr:hypothetical protein [Gammaproteobacteria bacterium]